MNRSINIRGIIIPRLKLTHQLKRYLSVNSTEVGKFSSVGSDWWQSSSTTGTGPLHAMNPARVRFIRESVAKKLGRSALPPLHQLRGLSILDVGCGGGILSESLARLGAKVTAIDPSPENIQVAKHHSSFDAITASIDYKCTTIEEMRKQGDRFDVVCALEVLEHVNSPCQFIRDCAGCLREDEGGSLILSTINRTARSYLVAIVAAEYISRMVPIGTHQWNKFITLSELNGYLAEANLSVADTNGIVLDEIPPVLAAKAICGSQLHWRLSEEDTDVNYIVHAKML